MGKISVWGNVNVITSPMNDDDANEYDNDDDDDDDEAQVEAWVGCSGSRCEDL